MLANENCSLCGHVRLSIALCDLSWSCIAFFMVLMAFEYFLWQNVKFDWTYFIFSRGHTTRSKFNWSCSSWSGFISKMFSREPKGSQIKKC